MGLGVDDGGGGREDEVASFVPMEDNASPAREGCEGCFELAVTFGVIPDAARLRSSARRLAAATASLLDLGVNLMGLSEGGGGGGEDAVAVAVGCAESLPSFSAILFILFLVLSVPIVEGKVALLPPPEETARRTDSASCNAAARALALFSRSEIPSFTLLLIMSPF